MALSWLVAIPCIYFLQANGLHVNVPAATTICFFEGVTEELNGISLNFEVLSGLANILQAELADSKKTVIYSARGASGRYLNVVKNIGEYTLCFKNTEATSGDVVVGFSYHADGANHDVLSNVDAAKYSTHVFTSQ